MLKIRRRDYQTMLDQLNEAYPLEACGLMAGKAGMVHRLYPVANRLASPVEYDMDPQEQVDAMLDLEEKGWDLLAIYHSHPVGPDVPSTTDIAKSYYPDTLYIIVSLKNRQNPIVRAFNIVDGHVSETSIKIL
jgi:proteasome lid subunit RPN8/RPN11